MQSKPLILTFLLAIGFSFPNCYPGDDCNCDPLEGEYFDVKGIAKLVNYKKRGTCCADALMEGETVRFADYSKLSIQFEVDYHSSNLLPRPSWDFSLMNEALACSCIVNGESGSKDERLAGLTVLTLNDFDAGHMANDTLNDLLQTWRSPNDLVGLDAFLEQDTALLSDQSISLRLTKAPETNKEFKVKIILDLSTGERYEGVSEAIVVEE